MPRASTTEEQLRSIPLLLPLSPAELRRLSRHVDMLDVAAGHVPVREGTPGHELYIIVEGRASVARRGEVVAELGEGDVFGELSLLTRQPRDATITALTPMTLAVIEDRAFRGLIGEIPALSRGILANLAQRLHDADVGADR